MRMHDTQRWLNWARRIQAISQEGMTYGKDAFDLERYGDLRAIAAEIISEHTRVSAQRAADVLSLESGYPTPKVDVRAAVFDASGRILLVKERSDGAWALPGGWADIGESVGEAAAREVYEEAGYEVAPLKLLGVFDRDKHDHPPMFWHVYKVFVRCRLVRGTARTSLETDSVAFFAEPNLPSLSTPRVTSDQIRRMFRHYENTLLPTDFD